MSRFPARPPVLGPSGALRGGLVAAWNFAGGMASCDPPAYYGVVRGSAAWTTAPFGSALRLPGGTGDFVEVPNLARWFTGAATVFAIARLDAAGSYPMLFSAASAEGSNNERLEVRGEDTSGQIRVLMTVGGTTRGTTSVPVVTGLGWISCGGVYDGADVRAYVNGAQSGTPVAGSGNLSFGTNNWRIGNRNTGTNYPWTGGVALVALWNRALSASEMGLLHANPWSLFGGQPHPMAAHYSESTGTTASLSATLGAFTLSGSATAATPTGANASLSSTLGSATLTGSATSSSPGASTGSLTSTLGAVTLAGAATSAAPGGTNSTLSSTLGSVTLAGSATAGAAGTVTGTLAATLGSATLSGAATSAAPGNTTGTLSAAIGSATLSGVVTISVAGTTATLDATLGAVTASGAATHASPSGATASLSATLGSVTFAGLVGAALVNGPTQLGASVVQLGPGGVTFTPNGPTGGTFGAA
jgi:hypothetical protein